VESDIEYVEETSQGGAVPTIIIPKRGTWDRAPPGLRGPPQHTSLANHTAFAKGVMSVLFKSSITDERTERLPHYCRFTPGVICKTWLCTYTRTIQESFVFRRLGPVFHRGWPSSIPGIGGTILKGVNPRWSDRTLSQWHSVHQMAHELACDWTLASAMWGWRLTAWTTVRPFAHRSHLFVRVNPRTRREHFVNSINHPVFSDWYDVFIDVRNECLYITWASSGTRGGAIGWGTALQARK
jgi:hypothetical protein